MPYEVTGREIAPSEVSASNGWCDIAPRRTTKPNLNVATNVAAYGATTKASKPVSARKEIIKASRMPLLPQNETKVVIRIRGGLNIAKTGHVEIVQAIQEAAGLETTQCDGDTICPNLKQNIMVVSSPLPENVHGYLKIQSITIAGQTYEASSYQTAPDDTCKGVIRNIPLHHTQETITRSVVNPRNPLALAAKRIKETGTVIVVFEGYKVPNHVMYGCAWTPELITFAKRSLARCAARNTPRPARNARTDTRYVVRKRRIENKQAAIAAKKIRDKATSLLRHNGADAAQLPDGQREHRGHSRSRGSSGSRSASRGRRSRSRTPGSRDRSTSGVRFAPPAGANSWAQRVKATTGCQASATAGTLPTNRGPLRDQSQVSLQARPENNVHKDILERIKALEHENAQLRRPMTELANENRLLKTQTSKPSAQTQDTHMDTSPSPTPPSVAESETASQTPPAGTPATKKRKAKTTEGETPANDIDGKLDKILSTLGQLQFDVDSLKKGHDRLVEAVDGLTSRVEVMEKGFGARIEALERTVFTHSTAPVNPPAYPMVRRNSATSDIVTPKTAVKSATKVESKNGEGK
ncbi:hypothetical protein HPB49_013748 [Dermacentor silvarum]|uniref:Uncharacterized protein n=1 Tax=Dermacentor silvarum TaxID=543639 RepID=A0ACB8CF81_DERSI|nr:hypothetical protein HPB49_013748 [Dermacentor silvarum]